MATHIRLHEAANTPNFKSVTIGGTVWMAENLDINDYEDGIFYDEKNDEHYYAWDAAMRIAESIPGWHLPTAQEWRDAALACGAEEDRYVDDPNLYEYVDVEELMRKLRIKLVGIPRPGSFVGSGSYTCFWSATECTNSTAYDRNFGTDGVMGSYYHSKTRSYHSVRLVKD